MIFDHRKKHKLVSEERKKILPPEEIVANSSVELGSKVVDYGCGNGFLTIPLAKAVGPYGRVYAFDISKEMIEDLLKRLPDNLKGNVYPAVLSGFSVPLNDRVVDFFFAVNVLHEVENIDAVIEEAGRVLKKSGNLVIVEWKKEHSPKGPPISERLDAEFLRKKVSEKGFKVKGFYEYMYHYQLVSVLE
ncbi:MAG: class I SAM-dependent methyltransferase [Actinobacteria bacterium]|nr:class I SAM-dependent methyltransferase [Actinomycetota bacterium]